MTETLKEIAYKEINIKIVYEDHGAVRFHVGDEGFENRQNVFSSLDDAKGGIDKYLSTKTRLKARSMDIAAEVVDEKGDRMIINGINRNDGSVRVSDYMRADYRSRRVAATSYSGKVYPNRQWIKDVLVKRRLLKEELHELERKLDNIEVTVGNTSYGRKVDIDSYEPIMLRMQAALERAETIADERDPAAGEAA